MWLPARTEVQTQPYPFDDSHNPDHPETMTPSTTSDTFYGGIPVFRGFTSLMDPALYSPLPKDYGRRCRYRGIDQGDRGAALQGGQHGGRRGDRLRHQCA